MIPAALDKVLHLFEIFLMLRNLNHLFLPGDILLQYSILKRKPRIRALDPETCGEWSLRSIPATFDLNLESTGVSQRGPHRIDVTVTDGAYRAWLAK